jgi:hypothetical protein
MSEQRKDNKPLSGVKDAYLEMIDETTKLASQQMALSKQFLGMAFETEEQIMKGMSESKTLAPFKDALDMNVRLLESMTKQATQGIKLTQTSMDAFGGVALTWGKMLSEVQKNYIQGLQNWMGVFRA